MHMENWVAYKDITLIYSMYQNEVAMHVHVGLPTQYLVMD